MNRLPCSQHIRPIRSWLDKRLPSRNQPCCRQLSSNILFMALLLPPVCHAAGATPLKADIYAGYSYDDNVTRAQYDDDIESDNVLKLGGSLSTAIPISDKTYLSLRGTLDASQYDRWDKLSNTLIGIYSDFYLKPSIGYTATRYLLSLNYEQRLYRSEQRKGSALRVKLGIDKNLTDIITIHAGYIRENIDAKSSVFDAENDRLYLDLEYRTGASNILYATLGYLDGNLVSTARAGYGIRYDEWVIDDAFTELSPTRWAYKLSGSALTLRMGDNYKLNHNSAIDVSLLHYDSEADNYNAGSYDGLIANLSYIYLF